MTYYRRPVLDFSQQVADQGQISEIEIWVTGRYSFAYIMWPVIPKRECFLSNKIAIPKIPNAYLLAVYQIRIFATSHLGIYL